MSRRVVFTASASADVLEAFRWIAERSPEASGRWHEALERVIADLAEHPERHPVAEEESGTLGLTIRQTLHGRRRGVYRILFSVEEDAVVLHYVRHAARGPIEP